jgi:methylated-DNA-[protein]-cysteine S-methyltransferase
VARPRRQLLTVRHRIVETSLGALTLVGIDASLTGLYFPGHWTRPNPAGFGAHAPTAFADAARQLGEYLAGTRTTFTVATAWAGGSPRQQAVWALIAAIPYGETRTYRELAAVTGSHPRAVGSAVARNPLSILVPCHRVIGSAGSLTGYAGGLERKRTLLELEGALPMALLR